MRDLWWRIVVLVEPAVQDCDVVAAANQPAYEWQSRGTRAANNQDPLSHCFDSSRAMRSRRIS